MEHLVLPKDIARPGPAQVPYVCKASYDGGPFLTYPARQEKHAILHAIAEGRFNTIREVHPGPIDELESFLQTWLFFGLLKEILGDIFDPGSFITSNDPNDVSENYLSTRSLIPTIETWMKQARDLKRTDNEIAAGYDHAVKCLQLTSDALRLVQHNNSNFDARIRISIASVAELLVQATNRIFDIQENKCPVTWALFYDEPTNSIRMRENGFCPTEIHRSVHTFMSLQTLHFLTYLKRSESMNTHQNCNIKQCLAHNNSLSNYVHKHRKNGCDCENLWVDLQEVVRILFCGSLPLLQISPGSELREISVRVVQSSPKSKFIALSHVWSDGLGNPTSNSLPRCQLQHLSEITLRFRATQSPGEQEPLLIWLDTLCCPIEPQKARTLALHKMRQPYLDAQHVLVLDSSLEAYKSTELSNIELSLRIFTSGWMRRLWTLQEGTLSKELWFNFSDKPVDLRALWSYACHLVRDDIGRRLVGMDIMECYRGLRTFFYPKRNDPAADLSSVERALQYRSVSVASDEPLLIAGLLCPNQLSQLVDCSETSRMQRLWSMMPSALGGIPENIIFRNEPKLNAQGFRWASATFLTQKSRATSALRTQRGAEHVGKLTPLGLLVRLPGFYISVPSIRKGLPENPWGIFNSTPKNTYLCRTSNAKWFRILEMPALPSTNPEAKNQSCPLSTYIRMNSGSMVLVIESPFLFDGSNEIRSGLIGSVQDVKDGMRLLRSEYIVNVEVQLEAMNSFLEAAYQGSRALLENEITTQFANREASYSEGQVQYADDAELLPILRKEIQSISDAINDSEVNDAIQKYSPNGSRVGFQALMANFYLGHYIELLPEKPEIAEFVVD